MQETKLLFQKEVEGNEGEAESLPDAKFLASRDTSRMGACEKSCRCTKGELAQERDEGTFRS